jgi:3-isopropylmalate/(R)-2-methylmalate dehydratase small subunit
MLPLRTHTGRGLPLRRSDVDTDQIIPSEYCRRIVKTGYADALFGRWRADPGFVLNDPRHAGATVLIAGPNFGTGSSREHAVWALRDWGVHAVIAPGFGDIFRRNALTNGLLVVELGQEAVDGLLDRVEREPRLELTVDLVEREVRVRESRWSFEVDERARWLLLNGFDEIDATLTRQEQIAVFERRRPAWLPRPSREDLLGVATGPQG